MFYFIHIPAQKLIYTLASSALRKMEYTAKYDINGGVSSGFGLKEPDHYQKTESFEAENPAHARNIAFSKSMMYAVNSLSNPETNRTDVTILNLEDKEGKRVEFSKMNGAGCDMLSHLLIHSDPSLEEIVKAKLNELCERKDYLDDSAIWAYLRAPLPLTSRT